jgi:predicted RNase H-like nuclease
VTKDELDALTCAVVAREERRGNAMVIGDPEEGVMILPQVKGREHRA